MELKIRNGDYVALENGGMEMVEGSAELIQRVLYRLTARREGFPFIPTLGSTLHQLGRVNARSAAARPRRRYGKRCMRRRIWTLPA